MFFIFCCILFVLLVCVFFIVYVVVLDEIIIVWLVNVGLLNLYFYMFNQMFVQSMVYELLVKYQVDGLVILWLVKSWIYLEDGKIWIFILCDDVKFFNGELFDVEVVVENFCVVFDNC